MPSRLYFCDYFGLSEDDLDLYGALNICLISDLPLFVDPFLLFQSDKPEYQKLHDQIVRYLSFLQDNALSAQQDEGLLREWFFFKEIRENWLGFTFLGNKGHGLGPKFAKSLSGHLGELLSGERDTVHLEQIRLIDKGIGRDSISDFTTNLIKNYLLDYTQEFTRNHIADSHRKIFSVPRSEFDYELKVWRSGTYELPCFGNQWVLLTPLDILARDETWINHDDLLRQFDRVVTSCDDEVLRSKINQYFKTTLVKRAEAADARSEAIVDTLRRFPELYELYIKIKESEGEIAESRNRDSVDYIRTVLINQVHAAIKDLDSQTSFYQHVPDSYSEALQRVLEFKHYVEHKDGYKVINRKGAAPGDETMVQLFFGLVWYGTTLDVNREPNNGRGPVDFKVSYGRGDKALVELKLASNTSLERNLLNQVAIYENANQTQKSIKMIICYTAAQEARAKTILRKLEMDNQENIVLIDARNDNKPSASKA